MYYALAGMLAPILLVGAKSAGMEGTRKGALVGLVGYVAVIGIYLLGLIF